MAVQYPQRQLVITMDFFGVGDAKIGNLKKEALKEYIEKAPCAQREEEFTASNGVLITSVHTNVVGYE